MNVVGDYEEWLFDGDIWYVDLCETFGLCVVHVYVCVRMYA